MSTARASVGTGSAGVSAGGAGVLGATESEQHDEQTRTDKDLLELITETHTPDVHTSVRVQLCGTIACLHFIFIR